MKNSYMIEWSYSQTKWLSSMDDSVYVLKVHDDSYHIISRIGLDVSYEDQLKFLRMAIAKEYD